jgi:starch synthase
VSGSIEVLSVASEIHPLVKTGGLADVVGALPGALAGQGVAMRVLVPGYPAVIGGLEEAETMAALPDLYGGPVRLLAGSVGRTRLVALDAPDLYQRSGNPYVAQNGQDWPDNAIRFAALSRVATMLAEGVVADYRPAIVHAHDWQAALAPAMMHYAGVSARSVLTVHNLAFQGRFEAGVFPLLGLPPRAMAVEGVEYYGGVGFLKAGLLFADAITTVSPTYAAEILTPEGGMGLDGLLRGRAEDLHGIVNGVDVEDWNPADDRRLAAAYGLATLEARAANRRAVEDRFGLPASPDLLVTIVSRLTWQKGMDLVAEALDAMVAAGARFAILGSGDRSIEAAFLAAAARHPERIGVVTGYDEALSHQLQGGADAILVPSRFEPCGLTQLYGLRYGCVPLVARAGGLADTVIDANDAALSAGVATGVAFAPGDRGAMESAVRRAVVLHREGAPWLAMQRAGMRADVSWERSAARYAALYRSLIA